MAEYKYLSEHPTRKVWQGMMNRCYTITNKDYPTVGGKGITVCEKWKNYDNFLSDMGEKPEGAQFARYLNTGNFEPDNCYWQRLVNTRTNPVYSTWKGIKRRCRIIGRSRHAIEYEYRGVKMHPDWENNFQAFYNEVGDKPSPNHQIDRIDNDLGYVPGNLRWALPKENANNRSDNIFIEMDGERKTLSQWAEYYGIKRVTLGGRFARLFEKTEPANRSRACLQLDLHTNGIIMEYPTAAKAAEHTGIKRSTILKCLSGGNASAGGFGWRYVQY